MRKAELSLETIIKFVIIIAVIIIAFAIAYGMLDAGKNSILNWKIG